MTPGHVTFDKSKVVAKILFLFTFTLLVMCHFCVYYVVIML